MCSLSCEYSLGMESRSNETMCDLLVLSTNASAHSSALPGHLRMQLQGHRQSDGRTLTVKSGIKLNRKWAIFWSSSPSVTGTPFLFSSAPHLLFHPKVCIHNSVHGDDDDVGNSRLVVYNVSCNKVAPAEASAATVLPY